jgi:hypothetical protein
MKTARIYRVSMGDQGNIGFMLAFDETGKVIGAFVTGQLPDRTNPPAGTYTVVWVASTPNHPNGVYQLQDVPGHTAVEMHSGNYFGDVTKGFKSDVTGCTLVADSVGTMTLEDGSTTQIVVLNSMVAISAFNQLMAHETFSLEVIDGGSLLSA